MKFDREVATITTFPKGTPRNVEIDMADATVSLVVPPVQTLAKDEHELLMDLPLIVAILSGLVLIVTGSWLLFSTGDWLLGPAITALGIACIACGAATSENRCDQSQNDSIRRDGMD